MKQPSRIAALLLCSSLLLTACGSGASNNGSANAPQSSASSDGAVSESSSETGSTEAASESSSKADSADARNYAFTFETEDLDDHPYDQTIFSQKDLTVVNIWATWCPPCKAEMPTLAKLAKDIEKDNLQLIGIPLDISMQNDSEAETAKNMLADAGAEYLNLKMTPEIKEALFSSLPGLPATMLLDANGKMVGKIMIGAREYDEFHDWIYTNLETLKK
ncbi:MAG: TlpA disulfide reductase family protein [Ndongobacter sp.]|nr:TlpA disulfide reductase family protein [Ndongobacter sp.]